MKSSTTTWRRLAAVGAGSLLLAACGGGSQPQGPSAGGSSAPAPAGQQSTADGTLTIGTLLPQTGSLASLGPPEFAGVNLAVKDINAAGGVLGKPIQKFDSDSGDASTNLASQSTDRLLSQKVDAIVGAASSSVSLTVIDKITGAGTVMISPANTSPQFTTYPDKGLYFRTAPSDVLQGRVLGNKIVDDGNSTVGILALQDAYGTGLAENVQKAVEGSNGQVTDTVIYDPKAAEFSSEVSRIKAKDPQAIVLIGFEESAKVIQEMVKQGIGPQQGKKLYLVDGNLNNEPLGKLPKPLLNGVQGTSPGAEATADFRKRLATVEPKTEVFTYAAESYDAVVVVALAAELAKSDGGREIAAKLPDVTRGGQKCTTFQACVQLAKAGTDFDYDGVSGPIEFSDAGDPSEASIGVYTYGPDNKTSDKAQFVSGKVSE